MQKIKFGDLTKTKKPTNTWILKIGDQKYERVKEFKYVGTNLTEDNYRNQATINYG